MKTFPLKSLSVMFVSLFVYLCAVIYSHVFNYNIYYVYIYNTFIFKCQNESKRAPQKVAKVIYKL